MGPVRLWRASDRRGRTFAVLYLLGAFLNLGAAMIPPSTWWDLIPITTGFFCLGIAGQYLLQGYHRRSYETWIRILEHQEACRRNSRWN